MRRSNSTFDKDARNDALDELEEEVVAELTEEASGEAVQAPGVPLDPVQIKEVFHDELKAQVRGRILNFTSRARLRAVHAR